MQGRPFKMLPNKCCNRRAARLVCGAEAGWLPRLSRLSARIVRHTRRAIKNDEPEERKKRRTNKSAARGRPLGAKTFPKNTLEQALKIPKAIEQQNAGNPMPADMLVRAVRFKLSKVV